MATEPLKHTPLPWSQGSRGTSQVILNGLQSPELIIARLDSYPEHMENARLIVEAVNSHHSLTEENERLRNALKVAYVDMACMTVIKGKKVTPENDTYLHGFADACAWVEKEALAHAAKIDAALSAQTPPKAGGDDD